MGEPAPIQFPFVGGLDEKTASTYLDPNANQASILNGSFRYVGRVDKRFGIQGDHALATCVALNPNGIVDPYVAPNLYASALGGLGVQVLQASWAWVEQAGAVAYAGKRPNFTPVRRPLPVRSLACPLICDGVVAIQGTMRAAAWISEPQQPVGTAPFQIQTALLDPATSQQRLRFPTLVATGFNVTLLNLIWFQNTGVLALFVVVETAGSAARELRAYTITPANSSNVWTLQTTVQLFNNDAQCLDVQPMKGDPNDGWIALYLPSTTQTQLTWNYFRGFVSFASGALANTGKPGLSTVQIVADWGIDVAFVWNDNPTLPTHDTLHIDYFSADGLFTPLASYSADPSVTAALGNYAYTLWEIGGACRVYNKTDATLNSEIYVSFWAADSQLGAGGPILPVTMGGVVARSAVATVTPMGFVYYPAGLRPLVRPAQVLDAQQVVGQYAHISHACVQDLALTAGTNPTAVTLVSEQCTEYLIDYRARSLVGTPTALTTAQTTIVSTVAPRQLDPYVERWNDARFLASPISADGLRLLVPIAIAGSGAVGTGVDISTMWLSEFTPSTPPEVALINNAVEVSGGVLMRAGPPHLEHGFVNFPEFITAAATAGPGITGTFSYAIVYARQDRYGNVERSAPSILAAPIVAANQVVALNFNALCWANDADGVQPRDYWIEIYRTLSLGSTYFYVARTDASLATGQIYGNYNDSLPDATLQHAQLLYTTGGVLDNVNPPAARHVCAHRGRLAIVDETLSNVWFSQTETQGEVQGFNEALIAPFIEGGDITAIASLDDKFVVFKGSSVWVMFGDGPADTGQGSDWTTPQRVPSDVGCVSAASALTVPQGIIFQSAIGFHLLGRDLQVAYIGKGVQDTVGIYSTCIASCIVPSAKQARWCMQDGNGNQRIICFDYFLNQWTVHFYAHLDGPIVSMFLDDVGVYTIITSTGGRFQESATSWLDKDIVGGSFFVPTTIALPWVKVSGPQGYMMARGILLYGEQQDASGLQVQLCYNYDSTVRKTAIWTNAMLESRPTEQVSVHSPAPYSKCESMQVIVSDTDDAAKITGQGFSFDSVLFDLVKIGDRYRRLPARLKA